MSSFSKCERNSRNTSRATCPADVNETFSARGRATSDAAKSWERCSEGFWDSAKKFQRAGRTRASVRQLAVSSRPGRYNVAEDPVHIAWSSSEEEQSDGERQLPLSVPTANASQRPRERRGHGEVSTPAAGCFSSRYRHLLSTGADTEDLPTIDSESEQEYEVAADISDCPSDGEGGPGQPGSALEPLVLPQRSVSEWVRTVQALLHTPQKQTDATSGTPEDSGKKRHSGGLAERLNRIQRRQRSAISFWRHQSVSNITTPTEGRPGVLVLRVRGVQEACGMLAALCDRPVEVGPCVALFCEDTATCLSPAAGDTIYVYPPWQSLIVEGEEHPIILNTHFSQVVCSEVMRDNSTALPRALLPEEKTKPFPLTRCFWQRGNVFPSTRRSMPDVQVCRDVRGACDSLLEAIQACGPSGVLCGPVEVVVQRVYFSTVSRSLTSHWLQRGALRAAGPAEQQSSRLCVLVQDVYGMFGEVELQCVSSEEELKHNTEQLEGKTCVLQTLRVIERLTRHRYTQLFSLIDSLWPPPVPLRVDADVSHTQAVRVPAPSFCYRLAGRQDGVVVRDMSPLYRPPAVQTLRDILQNESTGFRCSFTATVVHKREQSGGGTDVLLFVTDCSLQDEAWGGSRTLPVHVSSSCLLHDPGGRTGASSWPGVTLHFRDAAKEHSQVFCWRQSTVQQTLTPSPSLPEPVLLDQLGPDSPSCSLGTLTGEVVGVDEDSAYSWSSCTHCGSDRLEEQQSRPEAFLCVSCGVVDQPTTKMQLDVFLSCPSLRDSTVKVKLQQKSIVSLLNSTGYAEGYEVQNVLGKTIGPLSVFIHVISKQSTLWMGVEEVVL